jgi:hypothetical protein
MAMYDENAYNWLKRKGLAEKYEQQEFTASRLTRKLFTSGRATTC